MLKQASPNPINILLNMAIQILVIKEGLGCQLSFVLLLIFDLILISDTYLGSMIVDIIAISANEESGGKLMNMSTSALNVTK